MPSLKVLAQRKFEDFWQLAEVEMTKDDIASAIRVAYSTTPDTVIELRNIVKNKLSNRKYLMPDDSEIQAAIESTGGLAFDLFLEAKRRRF